MNLQPLHSQGPSLSRIVTGVWRWQQLSPESVERLIKTSIDEGITSVVVGLPVLSLICQRFHRNGVHHEMNLLILPKQCLIFHIYAP